MNSANWDYSVAMWNSSKANWQNSIAIWNTAITNWQNSLAMGVWAQAHWQASVSIWYWTYSSWSQSTAIWFYSEAIGLISTAIGNHPRANWNYSIALGTETIANWDYSTVIWKFNIWLSNSIFEIWIWTSDQDRANSMTVLNDGNVGIKKSNPQHALDVNWAIKWQAYYSANNNAWVSSWINITTSSWAVCMIFENWLLIWVTNWSC
jgi:hypothetical protein